MRIYWILPTLFRRNFARMDSQILAEFLTLEKAHFAYYLYIVVTKRQFNKSMNTPLRTQICTLQILQNRQQILTGWINHIALIQPFVSSIFTRVELGIFQIYYSSDGFICILAPLGMTLSMVSRNVNALPLICQSVMKRNSDKIAGVCLVVCEYTTLGQSAPPSKMQYLHFGFHANYFLLPWKIPEGNSRLSILFKNYGSI